MFPSGEISIDSFAGGGGASEGHLRAFGIDPDVAINHDPEAIAMHRANHPGSRHLCQSVYRADPRDVAGKDPVGLLWASPDCKHFSKAKGGQPLNKNIRDLAWVVVHYAERLPDWQKPRLISLENVEEFQQWCDLIPVLDAHGEYVLDVHGRPKMVPDKTKIDKKGLGNIFKRWVKRLRAQGYVVEWKVLRAADYDTPTIRKRLFVLARRDGRPIVWPQPTHGKPGSLGVKAGKVQAWRTAAELIDWSLPTHSIFMDAAEARALGCKRPLAPATMERIARGIDRYVLRAQRPFIVRTDMASAAGRNGVHGLDEPIRTQSTAGSFALVAPVLSYAQQGGANRSPEDPLHTVTASKKDQNALIAAHLTKFRAGAVGVGMDEPVPTVTANSFIKREGGAPPMGLVAATLIGRHSLHGDDVRAASPDAPMNTITASGGPAVVAAFLAQHNTGVVGHAADEPVSTITQAGSHQNVVTAFLLNQKGADQRMQGMEQPAPTICAEGTHAGAVYAFLCKYYGEGGVGQAANDPLHSVTTLARFGLVTVQIDGETYVIADIGMRMLAPRELFRAQGFRESYIIEKGLFVIDGASGAVEWRPLTKASQIRMCGNSVCPPLAEAILRANLPEFVAIPERKAA
ncbi:DNA cytosine methyltransferase [Ferrovibrio terrae]|uniref:DNA cytosine methyltransferase n=1 Tax=Ferrovibrio terrae TaxID=2594003 RepID=UPI0031381C6A